MKHHLPIQIIDFHKSISQIVLWQFENISSKNYHYISTYEKSRKACLHPDMKPGIRFFYKMTTINNIFLQTPFSTRGRRNRSLSIGNAGAGCFTDRSGHFTDTPFGFT